jgi:D-alanine transaminase
MGPIVYWNHAFVDEEDATVSNFDRGYLFCDGVYEVVPVVNRKLVDKATFLERLERSLSELEIDWPCSKENYVYLLEQLIDRNDLVEGLRGVSIHHILQTENKNCH